MRRVLRLAYKTTIEDFPAERTNSCRRTLNRDTNPGHSIHMHDITPTCIDLIAGSLQVSDSAKDVYKRGVRQVLLITLCLNVAVVIGKLIVGLLAGSLSVVSDAIHSAGDSINNIVGLVVMRYATAEPDEEHPYGHDKFETLAAFTLAGFLFFTCYELCVSAFKRLVSGDVSQPKISALTFGMMIATIIINLIVTTYEHRCGKRLKSKLLIADAIHTRSDVLVSCSVLIGLFLIQRGYIWLDPLVSFGVAVFIAWNSCQIVKVTAPVLVDAAPVPPTHITEIVENVPGVHSVHHVRSRAHGNEIFIEMHLRVSPGIERNHVVSHAITEMAAQGVVEEEYRRVTATFHLEPMSSEETSTEQTTSVVINCHDRNQPQLTLTQSCPTCHALTIQAS
jgi:cation diffusion facilitator family transporter